jgi:adiponectin receptor
MTSGHNSRTEDDSLGAEKPNIKRTSLVIWDESTETIANDENVTEVHIEIAQEEKHIPQRTVPFENVPIWMQDNALITDAYRPPLYSYKLCLRSLFFQHNESVNIWSHLLGLILFVVIGIFSWFVFLAPLQPNLGPGDIAVFYVFILGAMVCLGMSSSFHCFIAHSEKVCMDWVRADYLGIVTLTLGSYYPTIFYGFYCFRPIMIGYMAAITVIGAATIAVTLLKTFRTPHYRWLRAGCFLALGLFGIVPIIHAGIIYKLPLSFNAISLGYLLGMGVTYIIGVLIYGFRIPECFWPGKFNIWFASHQLFHICVVVAAVVHYLGVINMMQYWNTDNHNTCSTNSF